MQVRAPSLIVMLLAVSLAGCLSASDDVDTDPFAALDDTAPFLGYLPEDPDPSIIIEQLDMLIDAAEGVQIHSRIAKPEGDGPFPVIVQFTPYTAPGENTIVNNLAEPALPDADTFARQFVERGYAFAYADVRGTGDSSGCLDLRGQGDIDDLAFLIRTLGEADWSNGNVGFIGASYPGSEAHMAGLAAAQYDVPHLKAIVPIVASTSFYHYHHNDGVPYSGQHSLGGTNTGYTSNAVTPTVSPQMSNYATKGTDDLSCPTKEQVVDHGGLDQTGAYYEWWQERNLRGRAATTQVPVLMAQGLADWNVKPDHIATWFNDLPVQKTLIAGQWGHAYPRSASDDCETFTTGSPSSGGVFGIGATGGEPLCDPDVPYDQWWQYVTTFFDTHLKQIDTGMFQTDVAWVQANDGTWHRSNTWPLPADLSDELVLHLQADGTLTDVAPDTETTTAWNYCGRDQMNMGQFALAIIEAETNPCYAQGMNTNLVFESEPVDERMIISGVPLLDLALQTTTERTHITVIMDIIDADGEVVDKASSYQDGARQNYGYLNPVFRHGLMDPQPIPMGETYTATVDMYPQEDVLEPGDRIRITVSSIDSGRTIEFFGQGTNTLMLGPDATNTLTLPLRPTELQGVRLPEPVDEAAPEGADDAEATS